MINVKIKLIKEMKKTIFRTALLLIFLLLIFPACAQEIGEKYINPADPQFLAKYNHLQFNDKFVLLAESDATNNYYIADFSKLKSRFEKVFFLNLTFQTQKLVNLTADLSTERIWFLANHQYSEKEIIALFIRLEEQTEKKNVDLTEDEKKGWLKDNDKYK